MGNLLPGHLFADLSKVKSQERENHELGREGLRRCYADLRAAARVDCAGAFPGQHRSYDIADCQNSRLLPLGFAHSCQGVGCFSGLADRYNERAVIEDRIAVAKFRSVVDFDGDTRQFLEKKLSDQGSMPGGPAGDDVNAIDLRQRFLGQVCFCSQKDLSCVQGDATNDGFLYRARLLMNFLEHEMGIASFLGHLRSPGDDFRGERQFTALEVLQSHAGPLDDGHFAVAQKVDFARVFEQRWNIGSHKELTLAQADGERGSIAGCDDRVGDIGGDDADCEAAAEPGERATYRIRKRPLRKQRFNQVSYDFGIGFGYEAMPGLL